MFDAPVEESASSKEDYVDGAVDKVEPRHVKVEAESYTIKSVTILERNCDTEVCRGCA